MQDVKTAMNALSHGVYILGVSAGGKANLMTAAWITQISSSPALLVAVGKSHYTAPLIEEAGHFSVSVLSKDQRGIALRCGTVSGRNEDKLKGLDVVYTSDGDPLIRGAAAHLSCKVIQVYKDGDHILFCGQVTSGQYFSDDVLLYHHKEFFE